MGHLPHLFNIRLEYTMKPTHTYRMPKATKTLIYLIKDRKERESFKRMMIEAHILGSKSEPKRGKKANEE